MLFTLVLISVPDAHAYITCGSTCVSAAQISSDAAAYIANANSGAKCLLIASKNGVPSTYQFGSTVGINTTTKATLDSADKHHGSHLCGANVTTTSGWPNSGSLSHTAAFLLPYICAPVCLTAPVLPTCTDADADGYTNQSSAVCTLGSGMNWGDCNDGSASIKPGATETCNGIDDNCDGTKDNGVAASSACIQNGTCSGATKACVVGGTGTWGVCSKLPATETCNGLDDDCDAVVDDGLTQPSRACSSGTGACSRSGTEYQTCNGVSGWSASYSGCTAVAGTPIAETCNGIDDDCDGTKDNGVTRTTGCSQSGVCLNSFMTCVVGGTGTWGTCNIVGTTETCNGLDDDCNGVVDNSVTSNSGCVILGACSAAIKTCVVGGSGTWGVCSILPNQNSETCNNIDDNCNGQVDEGLTDASSCLTAGICAGATKTCATGSWSTCSKLPGTEVCNGLDDDCDGTKDDNVATNSTDCDQTGACLGSYKTCAIGGTGTWGTCSNYPGKTAEICGNNIDDDCNGVVDNGCACAPGATQACGSSTGICKQGVTTCDGAGQWGSCVGETLPGTETCNNLDDNCNGQVDEGLTDSSSCLVVGACVGATKTCSAGSWSACSKLPTTETCNNIDDNCNGQVDESLTTSTGCLVVGACVGATKTCTAGAYGACSKLPSAETCNNIDDDCNGKVDEGVNTSTGCSVLGACVGALKVCSAGVYGACSKLPITETCNGVDDDCSGIVDDGLTPQQSPYCGVGACRRNVSQTCSVGVWGPACTALPAGVEVCNNIDDNCNGQTDEGLTNATDCSQLGACSGATKTCATGSWGACSKLPATEICNGVDDNCDGIADNGFANSTCGVGACMRNGTTCQVSSCTAGTAAASEICGNNIDDNCNGAADEGCACVPGNITACPTIGICSGQTKLCLASGQFGSCTGGVQPAAAEDCSTPLDDNCNGQVNEGCACVPGVVSPCPDVGICVGRNQTCSATGQLGECLGGVQPNATDICGNTLDDNCDGTVDEGCTTCNPVTQPINVSCGIGMCNVKATVTCDNNTWFTKCTPGQPVTETCNNLDDDCNGVIDNYLKQVCGISIGDCKQGLQTCSAGVWGNCTGETAPKNETCDGRDNNCDGKVDEGNACLSLTSYVGVNLTSLNCAENWSCGNWTNCLSLDNETSRQCVDLNGCNNNLSQPIVLRNCTNTDVARAIAEHLIKLPKSDDKKVIIVTVVSLSAILLAVGYMITMHRKKKKILPSEVAEDLGRLYSEGPPPRDTINGDAPVQDETQQKK